MARNAARTTTGTGGGNHAQGEENSNRGVKLGMDIPDDDWQLESSDQPGMMLVSTVLTGNNYFVWSRITTVALGAKGKLGFVNGEIKAPDEHSPNYRLWKRTDCMVFCWIVNSLSKEIMEAFIYAETAKDLWDELAQVYGQCNAPILFQMKREIMNVRQGSDSVTLYFTKLKKLWGELGYLNPLPACNCECNGMETTAKHVHDMTEKVMQFLMGLDDSFDRIRQQILITVPLPSLNKAYSMVLVEEKFVLKPVENAAAEIKIYREGIMEEEGVGCIMRRLQTMLDQQTDRIVGQ